MLSIILFVSSGEIFIILLFILIFFGADKIPEFTRFMGKGVRELKKATDDIKREFQDSSSGVLNDIRSISNDLTESLTKEIAEPMQKTASETTKTFEEYQDQFDTDFYYNNQDNIGKYGNEYQTEAQNSLSENTTYSEISDKSDESSPTEVNAGTESVSEPSIPALT